MVLRQLAPLSFLALMACSSGGSGTSGGNNGNVASTLNGTWDVLISTMPEETTAVLELSPTSFRLDGGATHIAVDLSSAGPSIHGDINGAMDTIMGTHSSAPVDLGQLPFALGGSWILSGSKGGHCTGDVAADAIGINCPNLDEPLLDVLADPSLRSGRSTEQRTSKLSSIFGELGGEWTVVSHNNNCNVKVQGSEFHAECGEVARARDTITITFVNGVAAGSTSAGLEISARRR
jgi:hypothetical protein